MIAGRRKVDTCILTSQGLPLLDSSPVNVEWPGHCVLEGWLVWIHLENHVTHD